VASTERASNEKHLDAEAIDARMGRLPLYAVFTRPRAGYDLSSPQADALLYEHLSWALDLQDQGRLVAGGPLDYGKPPRSGDPIINAGGMFIIAGTSLEEVAALVADEPFTRAGWRTCSICTWLLNEGIVIDAARPAVEAFGAGLHDPAIPAWAGIVEDGDTGR
jgi:uncharacterized protein YciI